LNRSAPTTGDHRPSGLDQTSRRLFTMMPTTAKVSATNHCIETQVIHRRHVAESLGDVSYLDHRATVSQPVTLGTGTDVKDRVANVAVLNVTGFGRTSAGRARETRAWLTSIC
jgi:hypothetical protein